MIKPILPLLSLIVVVILFDTNNAFSVAPFGVVVPKRAASRSSPSLPSPPQRESLRTLSPPGTKISSSWFQWGTDQQKASESDVVVSAATAEAVADTAAVTEDKVEDEIAAAAEPAVAATAVELEPQVAAADDEPASSVNDVVVAVADAVSEEDTTTASETSKPSQRGPRKSPVKRDRHTVFVGNLPFDITDKELRDLFEGHAQVEFVSIPRNRETGQARGFAFVDVSSADDIPVVIENLAGVMVGGRSVRVTESLAKDDVAAKGAAAAPAPPKKRVVEEGVKKIYVGNLPFDTDREEMLEYYSQWGEVKDVYVPTDPATGEARGFAFISMDEENADKAIAESNGFMFRGRKLAVSEPLPPGEKVQRPPRQPQRTKLYVGNLSFYTVPETLRELFEQYGTVYDCYLPEDPSTGGSRGFGFITISSEDADRAIREADGIEVDGREIRVNEAQAKRSPSSNNYNNNSYDDAEEE